MLLLLLLPPPRHRINYARAITLQHPTAM